MPSPVGHALGGLIIALSIRVTGAAAGRGATSGVSARAFVFTCAAAACLPDIDFLWGRHNMETHSVGFALIVGALLGLGTRSTRVALACALSIGTHVLFDWLGSDDTPPLGVMALWPFTTEFYFANAFVFEAISRRYWLSGFVAHNLMAVLREIVLLLPFVAMAWWFGRSVVGVTSDHQHRR